MMHKDPVCGMEVDENKAVKLTKDGKTYYFCSEHCKTQFIAKGPKAAHSGHGGHAGHHAHMIEDFKKRFWISLIATIPVLVLSPVIQSFIGISFRFYGDMMLLLIISTFIFFYGGKPFLTGLYDEIKQKQPGMMTLIGLAITIAYLYSALVVLGLIGEIFFWELATLIDIMLLGHWIEMRSVMGASRALEELAKLMPATAHHIMPDGSVHDVGIDELHVGDRVLVKPGEKVPVDGVVFDGGSEVNEAMLTGESKPADKIKGATVIGGSINGTGALTIEVKKTGADSYVSQMIRMVREASESKSHAQALADRAAFWLTIVAITAGAVTLASWLIAGKDFVFALERMVTVMVITCPHALGLAIPLVIAVITAISAKNGLLIRNRTQFESARKISTVVFDKTGTLTKGEFGVTDIVCFGSLSEDELLRRAASIEANSEHTIAKGIVKKAKEKQLQLYKIDKFSSIPGKGAKAIINGEEVYIGGSGLLDMARANVHEARSKADPIASQGKTTVFIISKGDVQGIIGLADIIREESREAVKMLRDRGIEVAMITGDNRATAEYVAKELGLDKFFYEVLPDKKTDKIKELQKQGGIVAMVGDGVNDAPSLAQADVGIAIGAGTDVAIEAADIILVKDDPRNVVDIINISQLNQRKMAQNLVWATGYNVIAIPLAAGLLYNYGIVLAPAIGAVVMSLSTVIVAINARLTSYSKRG